MKNSIDKLLRLILHKKLRYLSLIFEDRGLLSGCQLLLQKEYNCKFYEEADKRINIESVEIDKQRNINC